jgi:hypothetical protein
MADPRWRFRVVEGVADLMLAASEVGGLPRPLTGPTGEIPSIVFRFVDGDAAGDGTVAIIHATEIVPGTTIQARVVFPDAPPDENFTGRRFELWLGHPVGSAVMLSIDRDERPSPPGSDPH